MAVRALGSRHPGHQTILWTSNFIAQPRTILVISGAVQPPPRCCAPRDGRWPGSGWQTRRCAKQRRPWRIPSKLPKGKHVAAGEPANRWVARIMVSLPQLTVRRVAEQAAEIVKIHNDVLRPNCVEGPNGQAVGSLPRSELQEV